MKRKNTVWNLGVGINHQLSLPTSISLLVCGILVGSFFTRAMILNHTVAITDSFQGT